MVMEGDRKVVTPLINAHTSDKEKRSCDHEWETVKEYVVPDSPKYIGSSAYFFKKRCKKCSETRLIDYTVEK